MRGLLGEANQGRNRNEEGAGRCSRGKVAPEGGRVAPEKGLLLRKGCSLGRVSYLGVARPVALGLGYGACGHHEYGGGQWYTSKGGCTGNVNDVAWHKRRWGCLPV